MSVTETRFQKLFESMQAIADIEVEDECPYCGASEYGVDDEGNQLSRGDEYEASKITEFHIDHDDNCPIEIAQKALSRDRQWTTDSPSA